ncbi:hypothetical protein BDV59DRAFT_103840 [Aspergillus ambiguus]|uniref:uncharacterized protein n=1 Tax=Aspergillus ambiguus TaxID=176160 RepID=UPI003CCC96BC
MHHGSLQLKPGSRLHSSSTRTPGQNQQDRQGGEKSTLIGSCRNKIPLKNIPTAGRSRETRGLIGSCGQTGKKNITQQARAGGLSPILRFHSPPARSRQTEKQIITETVLTVRCVNGRWPRVARTTWSLPPPVDRPSVNPPSLCRNIHLHQWCGQLGGVRGFLSHLFFLCCIDRSGAEHSG